MNDKELLDLYSDYLISSFGPTTGTGLAELLGGSISHDRIQRLLSKQDFTAADLWHGQGHPPKLMHRHQVVRIIQQVQSQPGLVGQDVVADLFLRAERAAVEMLQRIAVALIKRPKLPPVFFADVDGQPVIVPVIGDLGCLQGV